MTKINDKFLKSLGNFRAYGLILSIQIGTYSSLVHISFTLSKILHLFERIHWDKYRADVGENPICAGQWFSESPLSLQVENLRRTHFRTPKSVSVLLKTSQTFEKTTTINWVLDSCGFFRSGKNLHEPNPQH